MGKFELPKDGFCYIFCVEWVICKNAPKLYEQEIRYILIEINRLYHDLVENCQAELMIGFTVTRLHGYLLAQMFKDPHIKFTFTSQQHIPFRKSAPVVCKN